MKTMQKNTHLVHNRLPPQPLAGKHGPPEQVAVVLLKSNHIRLLDNNNLKHSTILGFVKY